MATDTETQPQSQGEDGVLTEEQLQAQVESNQKRRARREAEAEDSGGRTPKESLTAAAKGERVTPDEIHDALDLYLAQEGEEVEIAPHAMTLDVSQDKKAPKKVRWVVRPIDEETITAIRKRSQKGNRRSRRAGNEEVDENLVSRRVVVEATIEPNLRELADQMQEAHEEDALYKFFQRFGKTGLILQISGEILNISGYDEDDITDLDAALGS